MKFKVAELQNKLNKDTNIEGTISFKNKINDEIVDVSDATVKGYYDYTKSSETYTFNLHISVYVTSLCVITLEPVKLLVDFDTKLFYTFKVTDDDSFPIIDNIIDLDDEIWGEIILHMPLRVIKEGAEYVSEDEVVLEKENPFSELIDKLGEE